MILTISTLPAEMSTTPKENNMERARQFVDYTASQEKAIATYHASVTLVTYGSQSAQQNRQTLLHIQLYGVPSNNNKFSNERHVPLHIQSIILQQTGQL